MALKTTITHTFHDVEHEGDAEEIYAAIYRAKGKIIERRLDHEGEYLELTFEVPDYAAFKEAVKDEYYFDYLNG